MSGRSSAVDGSTAVREAVASWDTSGCEIAFAFASTQQDLDAVARAASAHLPGAIIVGCSTTGEHLDGSHSRGSLVMAGLAASGIRWASTTIRGLAELDERGARTAADRLFERLEVDRDDFDPHDYFCLLFIDGLRAREEVVADLVANALEGIPLVGGSAGDDLKFVTTYVIAEGEALTDAAVLVLGHAKDRFEVMKHQHFISTSRQLVITKVDTAARRVYEMDGIPAKDAYAAALGLEREQVNGDVAFSHPVTFCTHGEIYVRSIRRFEEDGSIVFFCGVEEGMVLDVGGHVDQVAALDREVARHAPKPFEFMLGCNCILRALEADALAANDAVGACWRRASKHSIGFDTYGEQFNGLHINQTLVAIGFRAGGAT